MNTSRILKARAIPIAAACALLVGCMSIVDINESFRRLDRMWQLDYQKTEDEFRYRVVDADYETVFEEVRKTFIDIGMPVQSSSVEEGQIVAVTDAPSPLTKDEWKKVVEFESPRVKEAGGWYFYMKEDPTGYIVQVSAHLRPVANSTLVFLEYRLDMPKFRAMGVQPSQYAPPLAVQLGSYKFWEKLESRLAQRNAPGPRRRTKDEKEIIAGISGGQALSATLSDMRRLTD